MLMLTLRGGSQSFCKTLVLVPFVSRRLLPRPFSSWIRLLSSGTSPASIGPASLADFTRPRVRRIPFAIIDFWGSLMESSENQAATVDSETVARGSIFLLKNQMIRNKLQT